MKCVAFALILTIIAAVPACSSPEPGTVGESTSVADAESALTAATPEPHTSSRTRLGEFSSDDCDDIDVSMLKMAVDPVGIYDSKTTTAGYPGSDSLIPVVACAFPSSDYKQNISVFVAHSVDAAAVIDGWGSHPSIGDTLEWKTGQKSKAQIARLGYGAGIALAASQDGTTLVQISVKNPDGTADDSVILMDDLLSKHQ